MWDAAIGTQAKSYTLAKMYLSIAIVKCRIKAILETTESMAKILAKMTKIQVKQERNLTTTTV